MNIFTLFLLQRNDQQFLIIFSHLPSIQANLVIFLTHSWDKKSSSSITRSARLKSSFSSLSLFPRCSKPTQRCKITPSRKDTKSQNGDRICLSCLVRTNPDKNIVYSHKRLQFECLNVSVNIPHMCLQACARGCSPREGGERQETSSQGSSCLCQMILTRLCLLENGMKLL